MRKIGLIGPIQLVGNEMMGKRSRLFEVLSRSNLQSVAKLSRAFHAWWTRIPTLNLQKIIVLNVTSVPNMSHPKFLLNFFPN